MAFYATIGVYPVFLYAGTEQPFLLGAEVAGQQSECDGSAALNNPDR